MKLPDRDNRINDHNLLGFCILFALFVAGLTINAVVASKIVALGAIFIPASVFIWSFTFPLTDIATEVYGRKYANRMVIGGFIGYIMLIICFQAAIHMPAAPFWQHQEAFQTILGASYRVLIAAITSFVIVQFLDVYLFAWIRAKTNSKHLWLRNNASTFISQTVANTVFLSIAFLGTIPFEKWLHLFGTNLGTRYALAFLDTAVVYAGVYALLRAYPELKESKNQI